MFFSSSLKRSKFHVWKSTWNEIMATIKTNPLEMNTNQQLLLLLQLKRLNELKTTSPIVVQQQSNIDWVQSPNINTYGCGFILPNQHKQAIITTMLMEYIDNNEHHVNKPIVVPYICKTNQTVCACTPFVFVVSLS